MKLQRILSITIKELHQLKRDKKMYPLLFVAPIVQLIILGYAATFDIKNIPTGILDKDRTYLSRQYVESFAHNNHFDIRCFADNRKDLCRLLDQGKIKVGIDIPVDFQKNLKSGSRAQVQIFIDGTESNGATIALNYANIISQRFSSRLILKHIDTALFNAHNLLGTWRGEIGKTRIIDDAMRIWYNPELSSKNFFVPGVICMILLIVTTNLTAISLVKEKEMGTLEQLLVTPTTRAEIILGKLTPFILIGLLDVTFIITAAVLIFNVPIKGSILLLFLFSSFFLFTTLGLGLFISTITHTQEQSMVVTFFFIITMVLLSGIMFPIENMPKIIQMFTYLMPIRYFAIIVRSIFLKGVGIDVLWSQGLCLLALGLAIFVLSLNRFKKKIT